MPAIFLTSTAPNDITDPTVVPVSGQRMLETAKTLYQGWALFIAGFDQAGQVIDLASLDDSGADTEVLTPVTPGLRRIVGSGATARPRVVAMIDAMVVRPLPSTSSRPAPTPEAFDALEARAEIVATISNVTYSGQLGRGSTMAHPARSGPAQVNYLSETGDPAVNMKAVGPATLAPLGRAALPGGPFAIDYAEGQATLTLGDLDGTPGDNVWNTDGGAGLGRLAVWMHGSWYSNSAPAKLEVDTKCDDEEAAAVQRDVNVQLARLL